MLPSQKPFRGTQLNRTHPLAKGLVGCWLFNEATGETVFDSSGNNNNGTIVGADWIADGLNFVRVNKDYVDCGSYKIGNVLTVSAWINIQSAGDASTRPIFSLYDDSSNFVYFGYRTTDNLIRTWAKKGGIGIFDLDGTTPSSLNTWYHFVWVWDGTTLIQYVNGISDGQENGDISSLDGTIYLGIRDGSNSPINAKLGFICAWNQVKSAEKVAWLYREPYAMFESVFNPALLYTAVPPVGAIMNQFQRANIGSDLYNGAFA